MKILSHLIFKFSGKATTASCFLFVSWGIGADDTCEPPPPCAETLGDKSELWDPHGRQDKGDEPQC